MNPPQKEALLDSHNYLPATEEKPLVISGDIDTSGFQLNRTKNINTETDSKVFSMSVPAVDQINFQNP